MISLQRSATISMTDRHRLYTQATSILSTPTASGRCVAQSVDWLLDTQDRAGFWGSDALLDRVIATCHAVMTLQACGFPATERPVKDGVRWLCGDEANKHLWIVWRYGPLSGVPSREEVVRQDIARLRRLVAAGSSPHPEQVIELNLLKLIHLGYTQPIGDEKQRLLTAVLQRYTDADAWFGRADTTSHALAVLNGLNFPDKQSVMAQGISLIARSARVTGPHAVWQESTTSTAYTIMNLAEAEFLGAERSLVDLCSKACSWLEYEHDQTATWRGDPPYGGTGDITNPAYFIAVAARAILAMRSYERPEFLADVWWWLWRIQRERAEQQGARLPTTEEARVTAGSGPPLPPQERLRESGKLQGIAALAAVVVAVAAVLTADVRHVIRDVAEWAYRDNAWILLVFLCGVIVILLLLNRRARR